MSKYLEVENWDESTLANIPEQETDEYEYKSSKIADQDFKVYKKALKEKIQKAASAFWNSGGGIFIAGYDEVTETIDGGIPNSMGRETLSDWVDTVLHEVEPVGEYQINTIQPNTAQSSIKSGHVVLAIGFAESVNLPHMAPDHRYYIRTGAHTSPAKHFIVEALRAKRNVAQPVLRGTLRLHPEKHGIIELVVASITGIPALDVTVDFEPRPIFLTQTKDIPFHIPFIDSVNTFRLDMLTIDGRNFNDDWFGYDEIKVLLKYSGYDGKVFEHYNVIDPFRGIAHFQLVRSSSDDTKKSLKKLSEDIHWFRTQFTFHILPKLIASLNDNNKGSDTTE